MCVLLSFAATKLSTLASSSTLTLLTYGLLLCAMGAVSATPVNVHLFSAVVNFSYVDPATRTVRLKAGDIGRFGLSSRVEPEHGVVVHVRSGDGLHHGCRPPVNVPRGVRKWIALIRRGDCKFDEKIYNAAVMANASAVVVYNQKDEETLITMNHFGEYNSIHGKLPGRRTNGTRQGRADVNGLVLLQIGCCWSMEYTGNRYLAIYTCFVN